VGVRGFHRVSLSLAGGFQSFYLSNGGFDSCFYETEIVPAEDKVRFPIQPKPQEFLISGPYGRAARYTMRFAAGKDFFKPRQQLRML
jgi:hypothetical protein